jgi:hypothetical protein
MGEASGGQSAEDASAIVSRSGWLAGISMAFVITGTDTRIIHGELAFFVLRSASMRGPLRRAPRL